MLLHSFKNSHYRKSEPFGATNVSSNRQMSQLETVHCYGLVDGMVFAVYRRESLLNNRYLPHQ